MNTAAHPLRRLLYRWFVQFNPLFTASALCVLGGVLVLSRAFGTGAERALTVVVELYQWLLIGVAGLLYRRLLERRPAAILGVIAVVFAMDPTLQVSALAAAEDHVTTLLWLGDFALKLQGLLWAFQLRASRAAQTIPVLGAALVAFVSTERVVGVDDDVLRIVMMYGTAALVAAARLAGVRVRSTIAFDEPGTMMFGRLVKSAAGVAIVGATLQLVNVSLQLNGAAIFAVVAAALGASTIALRDERALWTRIAVACFIGCLDIGSHDTTMVTAMLGLLSAALLAQPHLAPRVQVAGVLLGVAAAWSMLSTTTVPLPAVVGGSLALGALLFFRRAWSAIPALVVLNKVGLVHASAAAGHLASALLPSTGRGWGLLLVVAGFALLPLGVCVHRRLSRALADLARADEAEEALRTAAYERNPPPSSSAQGLSMAAQGTRALA
jgi:hypothetical protein